MEIKGISSSLKLSSLLLSRGTLLGEWVLHFLLNALRNGLVELQPVLLVVRLLHHFLKIHQTHALLHGRNLHFLNYKTVLLAESGLVEEVGEAALVACGRLFGVLL